MLRDPISGNVDRTSEQVKFRHLHMQMLRPLLVTLVIFLTVIIVVGTVVSALALYSPNSSRKKSNRDSDIDPEEDELRRARDRGTCVGEPPKPPSACILWNWNEKDYRVSTEILYYCHDPKDKHPDAQPVMRVICTAENHWLIILNKSYNCDCI
uniref:Uncharacterized protein n=1 Tax=Strigamia maritima TaxID=126957 RepID=T1J8W9_STRMM